MRLGAYECKLKPGSLLAKAYGNVPSVMERHRHRYEFNNDYRELFTSLGLVLGGTSPDDTLVESVEIPANLFHLGVQYHPEFKSRPANPQPIFREFVAAALENRARHGKSLEAPAHRDHKTK